MNKQIYLLVLTIIIFLAIGSAKAANVNSIVNVTKAPTTPTLTLSNTPIALGGGLEVFTANIIGGIGPYTYNYQVINSITGVLLANALYTGNSFTSNMFIWHIPLVDTGNTFIANVIVTDSKPTTVNSIYSATVTINLVALATFCANGNPNINSTYLYQNTNTSALQIFSDSANNIEGGYSQSSIIPEVVNEITTTNASTTLTILSGYDFEYIYSGKPVFHCIWLSSSSNSIGGANGYIQLPNVGLPVYSQIALLLFIIGIILYIILLANTFRIIQLGQGFVGGITNFIIGFLAIIFLIFSGFYTSTISSPSYTITSNTGNTIVGGTTVISHTLTTIPLISAMIILLSISAAIISGMSVWLFIADLLNSRKEKKKKNANQ